MWIVNKTHGLSRGSCMQYTEEEIRDIVRENQILKKNLNDAREELEATGRLYDTMVFGTKNLLLLSDGGSRSAVYVSPNVEEVLGLPRELVMSDMRELGPDSGEIPCSEMFEAQEDATCANWGLIRERSRAARCSKRRKTPWLKAGPGILKTGG